VVVPDQHPIDDVTSDEFYDDPPAGSRQPGVGSRAASGEAPDPASEPSVAPAAAAAASATGQDVVEDMDEPWITPEEIPSVRGALLRYRVMAYVVGTLLILLVCIAMPLKYAADMPTMVNVVGVAHGWLYAVLLITAYMLGRRAGWPLTRLLLIALAGTVPFLSFVAEHYARKDVQRRIAETQEYYRTVE
jgi:integral membrane protein